MLILNSVSMKYGKFVLLASLLLQQQLVGATENIRTCGAGHISTITNYQSHLVKDPYVVQPFVLE